MELKPCPFCGGEAKLFTKASVSRGVTRGWEFGIYCSKCNVTTPRTNYILEVQLDELGDLTTIRDERSLAITAWNRRADNAICDCNF